MRQLVLIVQLLLVSLITVRVFEHSLLFTAVPVVLAVCANLTLRLMTNSARWPMTGTVLIPIVGACLFVQALSRFQQHLPNGQGLSRAQSALSIGTVSVVIPARFEKDYIAKTVLYTIAGMNSSTLKEIILVDDASEDDISEVIASDKEIQELAPDVRNKIRTLRLPVRQGLTRGKIIGADMAQGTHILFLDGHCRIMPGAVEAMLAVAAQKKDRIVVPLVSNVNGSDWSLIPHTLGAKMFFHWNFEFHWVSHAASDDVPLQAGGIYLISKEYWTASGGYDPGMLEWGGENIEQSLRVWMCGGDIVVARNATIGHIFDRPAPKNKVSPNVVQRNHARAAFVWLDSRLDFFRESHAIGNQQLASLGQSIENRLSLKHNLKCGNFKTKFENKFQKHFDAWGMDLNERSNLRHQKSGLCLAVDRLPNQDGVSDSDARGNVVLATCVPHHNSQTWILTKPGRIFSPAFRRCLDREHRHTGSPILYACDDNLNQNQTWKFENGQLVSTLTTAGRQGPTSQSICLQLDSVNSNPTSGNAVFGACVEKQHIFERVFMRDT